MRIGWFAAAAVATAQRRARQREEREAIRAQRRAARIQRVRSGPRVTAVRLAKMQMGLSGVPWKDLTREQKQEIRRRTRRTTH
jgi:hypothetical protein